MKGLLVLFISATLLFSCKKDKAECEEYRLGNMAVKNNNHGSGYTVKLYVKQDDNSYVSSSVYSIKAGETWTTERPQREYKIEVFTGTSPVSTKTFSVQSCKTTEISIP